jgi:hypothetical protein
MPDSQESHNFIGTPCPKTFPNECVRRVLAVKLSQVILVGRAHVHLGLALGTPSLLRCVRVYRHFYRLLKSMCASKHLSMT